MNTLEKIGGTIILVVGIVALAISAIAKHDHAVDAVGYKRAKDHYEAREAAAEKQVASRIAAALAGAQKTERELRDSLAAGQAQRIKDTENHEKIVAGYERRLRTGAERMSVAVAGCSVRGTVPAEGAGAVGGSAGEARADLVPGAAAAILRIATGSAALVRDYNALLDEYGRVRAVCNAPLTP